ncbi:MAG TPA: hypothetical protein VK622_14275 [Puia sp.]|nr:hypothetical protein [Puia sp.]
METDFPEMEANAKSVKIPKNKLEIGSFEKDLTEFLTVFSKGPEDHKDDIKIANDFSKRMQDVGVKVTEKY